MIPGSMVFGSFSWRLLLLVAAAESVFAANPGDLDPAFVPPAGGQPVYAMALENNGRIVIGGNFTTLNGASRNRIARLLPNGSLDTAFTPAAGANAAVWSLALQTDGMVLAGGAFINFNGSSRDYLVRLTGNGGLDFSFSPDLNGSVSAIHIQSDGKILIGGSFTQIDGFSHPGIARLNVDGTIDSSFAASADYDSSINSIPSVNAIAVDAEGRVIIGGAFSRVNGLAHDYLARLNANGAVDILFDPSLDAPVSAIAISSDQKIILGGGFTTINNRAQNYLARLDTNGNHDVSFNPGQGPGLNVYSIALQPDGKMIIGGAFSFFNGIERQRVARLDADGNLDDSFPTLSIQGASVQAMALQPDGHLLIGGNFTQVNGDVRHGIARVFGQPMNDSGLIRFSNISGGTNRIEMLLQAPQGRTYEIQISTNLLLWDYWTNLFAVSNISQVIDPNPNASRRFYRAKQL